MKIKSLNNLPLWDYVVLTSRVLLAYTLIHYGLGKLTGHQFGVTAQTLNTPLKDIDLFRLSWYLADQEPFKSFIGISQLITAILLLWNRTSVIGAFMSIPIWLNILVWDITFMGISHNPFLVRIPYYLLLTVLILYARWQKVRPALRSVTGTETAPSSRYSFWAYLLLPVAAASLELIGAIPSLFIQLFSLLML